MRVRHIVLMMGIATAPVFATEERADCLLDPSAVVKVGSPVPGQLSTVLVQRGALVQAGQPVARLQSSVETATVALARMQAQSRSEIAAQEARVAFSRKKVERANRLLSTNVVAQQDLDALQAELRIAEQDLARLTEQQKLQQLDLARATAALDVRTIKSPIQGIVTEKTLSGGEYVSEAGHIMTIAAVDPLYVETFLPVKLYGRIAEGQSATVQIEAPLSGRYEATVQVVDKVFDAASSTFGVRLTLANPRGEVPAGLHCKVAFQPKDSFIPTTARK